MFAALAPTNFLLKLLLDQILKKKSSSLPIGIIVLLAALTASAPMSMDIYVSSLPMLARDLAASPASAQVTVTTFLIGLAIGQLVFGPLSDAIGRKMTLMIGVIGWFIASACCTFAPSISILIGARFMQGMFASAAFAVSRAVISDKTSGPEMARSLSVLTLVISVVPIVAPIVGGAIATVFHWRATFGFLAIVALIYLALLIVLFNDTLPPHLRKPARFKPMIASLGAGLADPIVISASLILGLTAIGFFAYISGAAFLIQDVYGRSVRTTGFVFAAASLALLFANAAFGRLSATFSIRSLTVAGLILCTAAPLLALITLMISPGSFNILIAALVLFSAGNGMVFPGALTIGQDTAKERAGAAAAVMGCTQFVFGAVGSPLASLFGRDSALPLLAVMAGSSLLALGAGVYLLRRARGAPQSLPQMEDVSA